MTKKLWYSIAIALYTLRIFVLMLPTVLGVKVDLPPLV